MRKRKRTALLAGLCLSMLLTGCGAKHADESENAVKIGVTIYDQYDTFVSQLIEMFGKCAKEKEKDSGTVINVEMYNASESQTTQNSQVEKMIADGCDVICVNLVDRTEPTTIIDLAEKNDVPIIFFNRELVAEDLERWERLYYVGAKAYESGILQGQMVADYYARHPEMDKNADGMLQYVVLEGEAGHQDAIVRTEYSVNTILSNGVPVDKLGYAIANWNRAQAQNKMVQLISQHGADIELVLANNDDMALGAIDALKASDLPQEEWPVLVGIDGTDVGLKAVRAKEMIGTVYNDKEGQADGMLRLAYALATDGDLSHLELEDEKYIRMPYTAVGADQAESYLSSDDAP